MTRSRALQAVNRSVRLFAAITFSTSASMTGSAMPPTLRVPFMPADRAERFEQGDFVRSGWTHRHHVGIFENGTGSLISAVHDFCVDPFEIERIDEGLTHTLIREFPPSGVEGTSLAPRTPCGQG